MGDLKISLSMQGYEDYRTLAKKIRDAGRKDLRAALRKRISDAGKPVLDEVKGKVLSLPITSHGGGTSQRRGFNVSKASTEKAARSAERRGAGLRETIARATKLQITAKGVRFVVASSALPADQQSLPRHLDSASGWRHPVFGNKSNWVQQKGQPYFAATIKTKAPQFRQAALDAIDEIARQLET